MASSGDKSEPGLSHWGDITVVVIYFLMVLGVGFWVSGLSSLASTLAYCIEINLILSILYHYHVYRILIIHALSANDQDLMEDWLCQLNGRSLLFTLRRGHDGGPSKLNADCEANI